MPVVLSGVLSLFSKVFGSLVFACGDSQPIRCVVQSMHEALKLCIMHYEPTVTDRREVIKHWKYLGGYSVGVPPLPIPNREVKPDCADGTAMQCGRVGSCLF